MPAKTIDLVYDRVGDVIAIIIRLWQLFMRLQLKFQLKQ